jgi:hypothetical protein
MRSKFRLPKPATVIALIALFVALSGTAVAAGIVPRAKYALNAGKLQGQTAAQVAAIPSPASTAASLVSTANGSFSINSNDVKLVTTACPTGQKAIGGGYTSSQAVLQGPTSPSTDGSSWQSVLINIDSSTASGTSYAVCLK